MAKRSELIDWVNSAVISLGGQARLVEVARKIWDDHEKELRSSGDLFFTWQYDMRWAAERLRKSGKFKPTSACERGYWETTS